MTNGQRMNQSVAPTSFMTSTSRRREKSDRRIVLDTSRTLARIEQAREQAGRELHHAGGDEDLLRVVLGVLDRVDGRVDRRAPAAGRGGRQRVAQLQRVVGRVGRDAEGVGQRVGAQQVVGLGVLRLLLLERLGLGQVLDLAHVRDLVVEQALDADDVVALGVGLEVDVDQHPAAHVVGRAGRRLDDRDEDAEHEHGDEHRGHGGEAGDGVARHRAKRLAQEEADAHQSRNASSNSSPGSRTRWGAGAGSRRSAPNSAVDMSRCA